MSPRWSLISVMISIVLLHISSLYATPVHSAVTNPIIDDNADEFQRTHHAFLYAMKNIVTEPNSYERIRLLNQLRESLNRLCLGGFFGASQAEACQHVADVVRQSYANNQVNDEDNSETSSEGHGIQKRFFCNGFIGCKNASG